MKKALCCMMLLLPLTLPQAEAQRDYVPSEAVRISQEKFRDCRFGIFIHWGIYSMLGQGEWVMNVQNLKYDEYERLASGFYPSRFDADEWVSAIKASGAKYVTVTTRHHDSFSMFDTEESDYNVVDATPFGRDVIGELAEACRKQDLRLHFYYSTLDWRRTDYPRGRTGLGTGRPAQEDPAGYFAFMKHQLTELLTRYGEIGCIWLDGHWDHDQDTVPMDWHYDEIYPLIHSLQPGCLIGNNHHVNTFPGEDIQIFERDVPGQNTAGWHEGEISTLPLETCQTMNGSWGYRIRDRDYKSPEALIRYLVETAGRDANLLLNIGPRPDGSLPEEALERLKIMGKWLEENGESIYGTRATLVPPQPWGVVTHQGNRIYLHVFPEDLGSSQEGNRIYVPLSGQGRVRSASDLSGQQRCSFRQYEEGLFVTLPEIPAGTVDFIVRLEVK